MSNFRPPDFAPYQACQGDWMLRDDFQRKTQTFGYFKCTKCFKVWISAHARKHYRQGCKECQRYYYPIFLWENTKKSQKKQLSLQDNSKPHLRELCQACQEGICISSGYYVAETNIPSYESGDDWQEESPAAVGGNDEENNALQNNSEESGVTSESSFNQANEGYGQLWYRSVFNASYQYHPDDNSYYYDPEYDYD